MAGNQHWRPTFGRVLEQAHGSALFSRDFYGLREQTPFGRCDARRLDTSPGYVQVQLISQLMSSVLFFYTIV